MSVAYIARARPAAQHWRHHSKAYGDSSLNVNPPPKGSDANGARDEEISAADADVLEAFASSIPLRCPKCLIRSGVKRIASLHCAEGLTALRDGIAFVCPANDLIGGADSPLLRWSPSYLRKHLPKDMKWPVLHRGTSKIIMTHTNRYMKDAELRELERSGGEPAAALPHTGAAAQVDGAVQGTAHGASSGADARFDRVRRQMMSFDDFLEATREHERRVREGLPSEPPYFGSDVFWRNSMADNGFVQNIGERMKSDLLGGANFASLRTLMEAGNLPLLKQVHLFVGSAQTLYHCHFDLQPNLHVQLVGRKRFIMFPPEESARLYAFPVHHDKDRRSQVDLDAPDESAFPGCMSARGQVVELKPGQLLYIPPGWWHHVQTCTSPCVSMAWWFYERRRADARAADGVTPSVAPEADPRAQRAVDPRHFGMSGRAMEVFLSRWLEGSLGKLIANDAQVLAEQRRLGAEQAQKSGAVWGGPKKERAVARWMRAIGYAAALRLVSGRGSAGSGGAGGCLAVGRCGAGRVAAAVEEGSKLEEVEEAAAVADMEAATDTEAAAEAARELLMSPAELAAERAAPMADIAVLPPLLEGIAFDLVEEMILGKICDELGAARHRESMRAKSIGMREETGTSKTNQGQGGASIRASICRRVSDARSDDEMGAPVRKEEADRWIVRVVRGRGFGRRGPA